eukprot:TRINITY_DN6266_c0_g1_i2.p1 TRINITY_DN6266_c0_g1~~TRINITY_DN6266_c0_g1_i2.p1  ORF type:complete len:414 (+),score=70.21 TRINITY_DN6266_c0_g1_i2:113-1354(+)
MCIRDSAIAMEPFAERLPAPRDDSSQFWEGLTAAPEEHEIPKLDRLREAVKDVTEPQLHDHTLLNFLRARDNKATKAEAMLREALDVLKKEQCHARMLTEHEVSEANQLYLPFVFSGLGRNKEPIAWSRVGRIDCAGFPRVVSRSDYIQLLQWATCLQYSRARAAGNLQPQKIEIYDLEGMGMDIITGGFMGLAQAGMKFLELVAPEFVGKMIIINAPGFFNVIWTMIRPMMSAKTASKFVICGADYQDALFEAIDPSQVPTRLGGTSTEFPEFWAFESDDKVMVPEEKYTSAASINGETVNVGRGSSHQVDVEVTEDDLAKGNNVLMWRFFSDGYDCGFGVFWKPAGTDRMKRAEMEEVFPDARYDCHVCAQTGQLECGKPGTYVLRFDNTYSYAYSKDVTFQVQLCEKGVR